MFYMFTCARQHMVFLQMDLKCLLCARQNNAFKNISIKYTKMAITFIVGKYMYIQLFVNILYFSKKNICTIYCIFRNIYFLFLVI